ncbi:hypothetical protein FPJ27_27270 [Burkholderia sp. MS455]|uniref:hypothetical protein n=1 Tax=Burkholderia sp. MS455 TaxID=2811788 RepID=UPI0019578964|nr:hypothetical protein [Burkholderia sp. MS455]QRR09917.1 hypothetical protein FPJ27_27270 [Burkholderia sp. MS455]
MRKPLKIFACALAALSACFAIIALMNIQEKKDKPMTPQVVTIKFGADGKSNAQNQGFSVMNHPSGVYAYQMNWDDTTKLGSVKYIQGPYSFDIDNAMIVTGLGDKDSPEDGVDNWDVNFNISSSKTISDEEGREKIMSLLGKLRAAGWKRYIYAASPRLIGREAMKYATSESGTLYSLDSTYVPTMEEWKSLITVEPRWIFYADGVFLTLSLSHQPSGSPGMGYYLTDIQVSTASDHYTPYFTDSVERRRNWKKLISNELKPAGNERSKKEAELKASGYTIDTTYQAPPFEAPDFSAKAGAAH